MSTIPEDALAAPDPTSDRLTTHLPDRPIPDGLKPLRWALRRARLARHQLTSVGTIDVGDNFGIGSGGRILSPDFFRAGDDVHIGVDFLCEANVTIGSEVLLSSRICLIGDDHTIPGRGESLFFAGRRPASHIVIEGDNLIGNGVIVLGSVTIGRGAVVGAGSLVLRDVAPHTIVAGRPAKLIRSR